MMKQPPVGGQGGGKLALEVVEIVVRSGMAAGQSERLVVQSKMLKPRLVRVL